jgi:putative SOS response-associated peptidase YedK
MCSRFENNISEDELIETFLAKHIEVESNKDIPKAKEFYPKQDIRVMKPVEEETIALVYAKWGIQFKSDSPLIFNSRIETISEKPYWKSVLGKARVVIPMTAFFEYTGKKGSKLPVRIFLKKSKLFYVPAIFVTKENMIFVSLITTEPNDFVAQYHNRMPVIFDFDNAKDYINTDNTDVNIDRCLSTKVPEMSSETKNK